MSESLFEREIQGIWFPSAPEVLYRMGGIDFSCLRKAQFLLCFPYRKGYVSLEDYTSFLIDKESENIKTSDDIESAFQALAEGKAYITKEDMKQVGFPLLLLLF